MILVVVSVAVVIVMGVTLLANATSHTGAALLSHEHAQARQIAETGVALSIRYVEQTPDWHERRASGPWLTDHDVCGGTVSVVAGFDPAKATGEITIVNASFEQQAWQLPNPLLNPPMSATISGWSVQRTVPVLPTGLTVPHIAVSSSPHSTDGSLLAYALFPVSIIGTATFSQTLGDTLMADTSYTLRLDAGRAGLALLLADFQIRVYAGAVLVASSSDPTLLNILDLGGGLDRYTLRFSTGDSPPPGNLRIVVHAESLLSLLSAVAFDNVRLETRRTDPLVLTSVGRFGNASHRVTAHVFPPVGSGSATVVRWTDP